LYDRPQDGALQDWLRALTSAKQLENARTTTLVSLLDDLADAHGENIALLGETEHLSYRDLAGRANQYARWAIAQGLSNGSLVSLLMPNRPDYVAIWIGLTRAGCAVALINTNLRANALLDSLKAAASSYLIADHTLVDAVAAVASELPKDARVWMHGNNADTKWDCVEAEVARFSTARLNAAERALPAWADRALLIGTSGTTGLPKAVNVTHARIAEWSFWFAGMMDIQPEDRLFNCLPMYHSTGGIVAIGAALIRGGTVVIRGRFSVTRFWDDVVDTECSIFMYIGELCRYLTASPPCPKEHQHRLRLACGNGLQADVWNEFRQRFAVPRILEFYAATEGVVSLYNCEGKPGAIGRVPPFLSHRFAVTLVRSDTETGEPVRNANGFCIACGPDEVGEAIKQIPDDGASPHRRFDGYTDSAASAQKIIEDAFSLGDRWFRTGDLMRRDAVGYFYFVDRVGDTFRWSGENVATTQVSATLRACPGVVDTVVFGVAVPGHEGRAGMAAIITDQNFDLAVLWAHLAAHLPTYARPLFIRRCETLEITGTMKLPKGLLVKQGYAKSSDPVWLNDRASGRFIFCNADLLRAIDEGHRRL